jgi:hypothetical protein
MCENDRLSPGSAFAMTDSGRQPINEEEFLPWLEHFKNNRSIGKCVLILDGHASHGKNIQVLGFDEQMIAYYSLCLPANSTHRFQAFDRSFLTAQSTFVNGPTG